MHEVQVATEPAAGAILRAIRDPGSVLPRLDGESLPFWQTRAVLAAAAPLVAAAARDEALLSLYADIQQLMRDYGDPERGVIASMPFGATLDQFMIEKYGIALEDSP